MTDIKSYWATMISELQEFELLADIEDDMIDELLSNLDDIVLDQFIQTATLTGIIRREKMIQIQPFFDDTLETRRFRVLTRWSNVLPYTKVRLDRVLRAIVGDSGYEIVINPAAYTLDIYMNLGQYRMLADATTLVRKMTPANLIVSVSLRANRYVDLLPFSYADLSVNTYTEIREEVL